MNRFKYLLGLMLICTFIFLLFGVGQQVKALSATDFKAGRLIDDVVFTNKSSMSVNQIQSFINSKVPVCETQHSSYTGGSGTVYSAPFTCLKDYQENILTGENNYGKYAADKVTPLPVSGGKTAAEIIWQVAQDYNINPQVLIIILQKEQGLITDTWPILPQYTKATGYRCPDSVLGVDVDVNRNGCYDVNEGFYKQVSGTGWQLRNDFNGIDTPNFWSKYGKGWNDILYNEDIRCGASSVFIENQATAVLYKYTGYQPNAGSIAYKLSGGRYYSTLYPDCGAYGNLNFWKLFNDWFGSTLAPNYDWSLESQLLYTDQTKTSGASPKMVTGGNKIYAVIKIKNTGNQTWLNNGPSPVRLGTSRPYERYSVMCDTTWLGCNRPASLTESSVAPGGIGTFEFWMKPNTSGKIQEYFTPVVENIVWMRDIGLFYGLDIGPPTYTWQLMSQYAYTDQTKTTFKNLANLLPGEKAYIGFTAKNTGNQTWMKTGSFPVSAGTISPQERSSLFSQGSLWLSGTRPSTFTEATVPPGQVGTFEFWITAPAQTGIRNERFGLIANGLTWMNDTGLSYYTDVR